jgi:hypothetical protein
MKFSMLCFGLKLEIGRNGEEWGDGLHPASETGPAKDYGSAGGVDDVFAAD